MNNLELIGINAESARNLHISSANTNLQVDMKHKQSIKNNAFLSTTNDISAIQQSRIEDLSYQNYEDIPIRSFKEESCRYGEEIIMSRDDSTIFQNDGNCHQSAIKARENFFELYQAQQKSDSVENENISTPKAEEQIKKANHMTQKSNLKKEDAHAFPTFESRSYYQKQQGHQDTLRQINIQKNPSEMSQDRFQSRISAIEQISQVRSQMNQGVKNDSDDGGLQRIWKKKGLVILQKISRFKNIMLSKSSLYHFRKLTTTDFKIINDCSSDFYFYLFKNLIIPEKVNPLFLHSIFLNFFQK